MSWSAAPIGAVIAEEPAFSLHAVIAFSAVNKQKPVQLCWGPDTTGFMGIYLSLTLENLKYLDNI